MQGNQGILMTSPPPDPTDPYLWLEDVDGPEAMAWVRARNAETAAELEQGPPYRALEDGLLRILDSAANLPYIGKAGAFYYNFWRDAGHPRGIWRRTTLEEYRKAEPAWELVLDLDALSAAEGQSWVFQGARFLKPGYRRCLVMLSPGGSDAHLVREFDLDGKRFVEGGFSLPLAKSSVSWIDQDTLFVGTDFGPGSLTGSGYSRIVKRWRRGTPLDQATTVFEGRAEDMAVEAHHDSTEGFERDFIVRKPSFFTEERYLLGRDGALTRVELPTGRRAGHPAGMAGVQAALALDRGRPGPTRPERCWRRNSTAFMAGRRRFTMLFRPSARRSLEAWSWTRHHLILNLLEDVKNRLYLLTPAPGAWQREPLPGVPAPGQRRRPRGGPAGIATPGS